MIAPRLDRFAFVDRPEPRLVGHCADCGRELYAHQEIREGDDGRLYCDAVCAGYAQSRPYVPDDGGDA